MPFLDTQTVRAASLERGDGAADLVFAASEGASRLAHLYQHDPCRVLFPRAESGNPPLGVLVTTSGGLAGGDRLRIALGCRDGAAATVTTQAAEKIYRSLGPDCRIDVAIDVGRAWLEYIPQETILFDRARLRRRTDIDLAPGGRFLGCEMLVFGRLARGETFAAGLLHDVWRIRRGGALIWADALRLDGGAALTRPLAFAGATAFASAVYAADDVTPHLERARELASAAECRAGASIVNGVLLARFLGDAACVRRDLAAYLSGLRRQTGGFPAALPRVWH